MPQPRLPTPANPRRTAGMRRLFGALLAGAVLQLADVLCSGVCSALTALLEGPRATQLAVAQLVLSLAHLALARASLRAVPPRLAFYLAVRQLDISFGGAGTFRLIALMKRLESWDVLPLHPPPMRSLPRLTSDEARGPFLVMPVCRSGAPEHCNQARHRGSARRVRSPGRCGTCMHAPLHARLLHAFEQ